MTLYLFHGQEEYLMEKEIGKLKDKLLDKSFISMNYKSYSNPKFVDLIDILNTQPMMFGNSLILVEIDKYLNSKSSGEDSVEEGAGGFDEKQLVQIEQALSCVPLQINIVFLYKIDRSSNKKIDTRKKIYKILSSVCKIQEFKQLPTYDKMLPSVIIKLAKELEIELTNECSAKIVEMLGSNLRVISNELEKLKVYIYPNNKPTIQNIEEICSSTKDVFKLVDYFILSKKDEAMKEFKLLTQTQHPLQILALLQSTISRFINLKLLSRDMSAVEISKITKMHEYKVKLELEKIRGYKYDDLLQLKKNLTECEFKIKSGQVYNEEVALEQIILSKAV